MSAAAARRVVVEFPEQLLDRAERVTQELSISRSELVRQAVEQFIESRDRAKLERELAEGYRANARLDRAIGEEFAAADYDTF
jgi:metal-responsive CopG/Arc/MetJ family transcriptional regulator